MAANATFGQAHRLHRPRVGGTTIHQLASRASTDAGSVASLWNSEFSWLADQSSFHRRGVGGDDRICDP